LAGLLVASLTSSITSFIGNHGVYAVFLLMAIDAVFPAGSELVMVYAGALASAAFSGQHVVLFGSHISSGASAFVVMALSGTLGYTVGALVGWAVGVYGGRPLLERRGRWLHLTPERLDHAERWFDRWQGWAVFLGRLTTVVRSFISIPAGVFRASIAPYTALTLAGSAIWCFALAGVGWGVGKSYHRFDHGFRYAEYAIVAAVIVLLVLVALRWRSSTMSRRADDSAR
jgi:membrane protein DedA with SNARE-associated domain